jgi:hypothetical protein
MGLLEQTPVRWTLRLEISVAPWRSGGALAADVGPSMSFFIAAPVS